jgi:sodium transport system permease protein
MAIVRVILFKELLDAARDRRSMLSALIYPLVGPALVGLTFTIVADMEREARNVEVPVVGAEHAPDLMHWMEQRGATVVDPPADPEAAVASGEVPVVLVIPDDFGERMSQVKPAEVELVVDGSRNDARASVMRVRGLVEGYGGQLASLRLIARGVSPELAMPVVVHEVEVASPQQLSANLLNFFPMFVVLAAFIGGMQVAADITAGERERASLEPLLLNPVPRTAIVVGKWLAAVCFGLVSLLLTLLFCVIMLAVAPIQELGLKLAVGPSEIIWLIVVTAPMAFLAAGLQVMVASFARSFKEAQTYLSLLIFLPMIPGFVASFHPLSVDAKLVAIPVLGQQIVLTEILGGQPIGLVMLMLAAGPALILGLLFVLATARLFGREAVVFGRG